MKKLATAFLFTLCFGAFSQDLTSHFTEKIHQSVYTNPSYFTEERVFFDLGGVYANFKQPVIAYHALNPYHLDQQEITYDYLAQRFTGDNNMNIQLAANLLSLNLRGTKNSFNLSLYEKLNLNMNYSDDLMKLVWFGNGDYNNKKYNLSPTINLASYKELGFGYARKVSNLNFGMRMKLLFGNISINTDRFYSSFSQSEGGGNSRIRIEHDIAFQTSGLESIKNYNPLSLPMDNIGSAFDIGISYQKEKVVFSASILDVGSINWKKEVFSYSGSGVFNSDDFISSGTDSITTINVNTIIDSVQNYFSLDTSKGNFETQLNPQLYLSGRFHVSESVSFYGLMHAPNLNDIEPQYALGVRHSKTLQTLDVGVFYTYRYKKSGVGFNMVMKGELIRPFFTTDDLLALKDLEKNDFNLRMGINILIVRKQRKKKIAEKNSDS